MAIKREIINVFNTKMQTLGENSTVGVRKMYRDKFESLPASEGWMEFKEPVKMKRKPRAKKEDSTEISNDDSTEVTEVTED